MAAYGEVFMATVTRPPLVRPSQWRRRDAVNWKRSDGNDNSEICLPFG